MKKLLLLLFLFTLSLNMAWGENIDLSIISTIESNNNPLAYNYKSKAIGLCQITPIVLDEYNWRGIISYPMQEGSWVKDTPDLTLSDLYIPHINMEIANWYINIRIPQMLKAYNIPDTIETRLICFNWGIGNLNKFYSNPFNYPSYDKLPKETRNYIKRYIQLLKRS